MTAPLPSVRAKRARPASRPAAAFPSRARRLKEQRILEAAEPVFAEAGFGGASMQAIAERAGLPKANLHYYFGTKQALYRALLARNLDLWLDAFDHIVPERDPADALAAYVRDKMQASWERPLASKVFANEVIHGAVEIGGYLSTKLRQKVDEKAAVIDGWAAAGRIAPVDARHLFFTLWAATQTYADFDVQVCAVLDRRHLTKADLARATDHLVAFVLRGCGLTPPAACPPRTA